MGTGATVNVSDQEVKQWLDTQLATLKSQGETALQQWRALSDGSDALLLSEYSFGHIALQGDFDLPQLVTGEMSKIVQALFNNGTHRSVVAKASASPSAAVRAVGEACSLLGDLVNWWAGRVRDYPPFPSNDVRASMNHGAQMPDWTDGDLGAGLYLRVYRYFDCVTETHLTTTAPHYYLNAYAFRLTYSHTAWSQYEEALDAGLIAKLKQELQDKLNQSVARSAKLGSQDDPEAALENAVRGFWSASLGMIADAEPGALTDRRRV